MKLIKTVIIIASIVSTVITIYTLVNGVLYILTALNIIDEDDSDYLEVSSDFITVGSFSGELVNSGDYWLICEESYLDNILQRIGAQGPQECLKYSRKYSHEIIPKNLADKSIGSENKQLILQVMANEISEGRPVIPRVRTSSTADITVDGKVKHMCGRHFVAVVRNKKRC